MAGHVQIIKNTKFSYSLQYLKKEVSDEVDFVLAHEHECFLQINTMILMWMVKHSQSSQNSKFMQDIYSIKKVRC